MRYLPIISLLAVALTGCTTTPPDSPSYSILGLIKYKKQANTAEVANASTLKTIDYANTDPGKNRYRLGPVSIGSWVNQKEGSAFQQVTPTDPTAAIVYLYRIESNWNKQEIVAPNFFLNDQNIPSLVNNHYYWIELPAGTYRLNISRPVGVVHFQKGTAVDFSVEAGKKYFLRYEEQRFRGKPNKSDGLLQVGPLVQMPTQQGLAEISSTTLKTPGISFVKRDGLESVNLPVFNGQAQHKASKDNLAAKKKLHLTKPFKIWNPLTW